MILRCLIYLPIVADEISKLTIEQLSSGRVDFVCNRTSESDLGGAWGQYGSTISTTKTSFLVDWYFKWLSVKYDVVLFNSIYLSGSTFLTVAFNLPIFGWKVSLKALQFGQVSKTDPSYCKKTQTKHTKKWKKNPMRTANWDFHHGLDASDSLETVPFPKLETDPLRTSKNTCFGSHPMPEKVVAFFWYGYRINKSQIHTNNYRYIYIEYVCIFVWSV